LRLTKSQIKQFEDDGFIVIREFLNKKNSDSILKQAQLHIQKQAEPIETEEECQNLCPKGRGETLRRLRQAYSRDKVFASWMTNSKINPILQQLLDDKAVLTLAHHNSIMTKMPKQNTATCWHQDIRYWNFQNDNLVSVWLSLMEENINNGVLWFIPSSHKIKLNRDRFDDNICLKQSTKENKKLISTKVKFDLYAGDIVIFHSKTLHSANANSSKNKKISFVYTVRAKNNLPIKNSRSSSFAEIEL
jgi:phytanoyl-CoA hydroxylase